jgi:hypothetical protein
MIAGWRSNSRSAPKTCGRWTFPSKDRVAP